MRRALLTACVAAGTILAAVPLQAQKDEPERPRLAASVDTNDAYSYYNLGLASLDREPEQAADAFYWATRLNPGWAEAYYARRSALLLTDRRRLLRYWNGDKGVVRSREIKRIDSLYLHALALNPFLYEKLEQQVFHAIIRQISDDASRNGSVSPGEVEMSINRYISSGPASLRAWIAYGEGRFTTALDLYADAIKQARKKASLRTDRGRLFLQLNHPDSALAELTLALEEMRKTDKKDLVYVYQSKALMEHSIAMVKLRMGDAAGAREAFGRALEEDLAYFPAHVQLGFMALEAKDTTAALGEMDLAVQLKADDPWLRYTYGFTLNATGQHAEAEAQLRKAIELNPVYAASHFALAQALEGEGRGDEAVAEYRTFLSLASRQDMRRQDAEARVAGGAAIK